MLNALNIDPSSLIPRTEADFKQSSTTAEAASTLYRYHMQRRLLNYKKVKDFMNKTRRRQGNGSCIYLSKEGQSLMGKRGSEAYFKGPPAGMPARERNLIGDRSLDNSHLNRSPYQLFQRRETADASLSRPSTGLGRY